MELATVRGHYGELRPRYHKLEARCEEQEKRIRALVEEVIELRPLRESLGRLGDEVRGGRAQWASASAHTHVLRTYTPAPTTAPAGAPTVTRGYGMRDVLLGNCAPPPVPADAPAPVPEYTRSSAPASLPEVAWVESPTLRELSPALQASAAQLATFAAAAHAERQALQSELSSTAVRLAAETEAAAGLRAQVQALQLSQAAYGQQAMSSVQQFTSQLQSNEATNSSRIRELERENCQLLRCRDTLDHLKYVVASSGGGGQSAGATGLALLKSHLPRLIDLTPPPPPAVPDRRSRSRHRAQGSSEGSDTDNDTDSLEHDDRERGSGACTPPRDNPNRSKRRYLHINSPSRDVRAPTQMRGEPRSQAPADSADAAAVAAAAGLPAVNDIDAILRHFTDAMLSEVVGRALLGLDRAPPEAAAEAAEEERRIRHRMKRQLEQAQQKLVQAGEEVTALTAERTQLSAQIKALQTEGSELSKDRKRLAVELEELLTLSEKQQALTAAQENKLAFYKQEKSMKVAQISSLQQREHAMKARLVAALQDFANTDSLVDSVQGMIGRWSGASGAEGPHGVFSYYLDSPAANAAPLSAARGGYDASDRAADVVHATVTTMSSLHRCLTAVNRAQVDAAQRMKQQQQFAMQQQQQALGLLQLQLQQTQQLLPTSAQQDPFAAQVNHSPNSSAPRVVQGISLKHNALGPPRKEDSLRTALATHAAPAGAVGWNSNTPVAGVSFDLVSVDGGGLAASGGGRSLASAPLLVSATQHALPHGQGSGGDSRIRPLPRQESHAHSGNVAGLMSPATLLQNRLKDAKNKFAGLREAA